MLHLNMSSPRDTECLGTSLFDCVCSKEIDERAILFGEYTKAASTFTAYLSMHAYHF